MYCYPCQYAVIDIDRNGDYASIGCTKTGENLLIEDHPINFIEALETLKKKYCLLSYLHYKI